MWLVSSRDEFEFSRPGSPDIVNALESSEGLRRTVLTLANDAACLQAVQALEAAGVEDDGHV